MTEINSNPEQTAPTAPEPTAPAAPELTAGRLVSVTSETPFGTVTQVGVVKDVLDGDRVTVAWFSGLSGPLDAADVQAL